MGLEVAANRRTNLTLWSPLRALRHDRLTHHIHRLDEHRLFSTTPSFLKYLGLRDLADLPPLPELQTDSRLQGWAEISEGPPPCSADRF